MDNVNLISILKSLKTLSKCGLLLRQRELGFQPTWGKGHSHPCRPWLSILPMLFMLFTANSKFNRLTMFSMTDSRFNRLPRLPATRFDQFCCSIHVLESLVLKIAYNQNKILAFFFSILFCPTEFLQLKNISPVKFFTGSPTSLSRNPSKPYNLFNTYPDLRPQDTQWVEESEHHFFFKKSNQQTWSTELAPALVLFFYFSCSFSSWLKVQPLFTNEHTLSPESSSRVTSVAQSSSHCLQLTVNPLQKARVSLFLSFT